MAPSISVRITQRHDASNQAGALACHAHVHGKARWAAKYVDAAMFAPTQNAVVGNVAYVKAVLVGKPDRSFEPAIAFPQCFQSSIRQDHGAKAVVDYFQVIHCATGYGKVRGVDRHAIALS